MHSDKNFRKDLTDEMILAMYRGSDEDFAQAKALAWVLKKLDEEYPTVTYKDVMVKLNGDDFVISEDVLITSEPGGNRSIDITYDRDSTPFTAPDAHTRTPASPRTSPYFF